LVVTALLVAGRSARFDRQILVLLIVMYVPLAWVVPEGEPFGHYSIRFTSLTLAPAGWTVWLNGLFGVALNSWLTPIGAYACFLGQFAFATFCASRGWRWTLPYAAILFVLACLSSLIMHALFRF
jgi:hypothetical protein